MDVNDVRSSYKRRILWTSMTSIRRKRVKIICSDGNIVQRHFDQVFKQVKPSCEIENNSNFSPVNERCGGV